MIIFQRFGFNNLRKRIVVVKNLFLCVFTFTLWLNIGFAQGFFPSIPPDSVRLHIAFPAEGDTLNSNRVRYAGSALPTAKVWVQGIETKVYPSGAFVGLASLDEGINAIDFRVEDTLGSLRESLIVFRKPERKTFAEIPTAVDPDGMKPASDVYLSQRDKLEVEFWGSPGGQAIFSIDKIAKNVQMMEMPGKSSNSGSGHYKGLVVIPNLIEYKPKEIKFKFRGKNGRRIKFRSAGKVNILSPVLPLIGVTIDSINLILTKPDGEIWMALPAGIKIEIIARQNAVSKVRLAEGIVGFTASKNLQILPPGTPFPSASIGSIGTLEDSNWVKIRVNVSHKVPFEIQQILDPAALEVTFFRSRLAPQWIMYPRDDETIRTISWRQESSEEFVLRIELNQKQQWGYLGRYIGKQFWLNIRKAPVLSTQPDSTLKKVIITIDPGHGGKFAGAVSATGLFEKEVNLQYAARVAGLLRAEGAAVFMTRTQDTTMTLRSRIDAARAVNSHIFISLHNNSIGASTNPLRTRGASTYYTVPQSQEIAKDIYHRLLDLGLEPFGRVSSTYYVTRQTDLISLIVEAAFMTHPEDEMLLLDNEFLDEMAAAVAAGIKDFVVKQTPNRDKPEIPKLW
ncbi:MAG: N-acetylmuramoyl-L-alanine amidase [Caldithrix sp.]|nr:MAG: N-acetylmuramoyl-L-alanine amidase [Caldithrix sp.]